MKDQNGRATMPAPPAQIQMAFNIGEAAPGIVQLEIAVGNLRSQALMTVQQAEAAMRHGLAQIEKIKRSVLVVPPGALPPNGKVG